MQESKGVKFGVDAMLGKLARFLRLLGYDTLYWRDSDDEKILESSLKERRIIISRDKSLCKKAIDLGISVVCFSSSLSLEKYLSCLKEAGLIDLEFTPEKSRCPLCNGELYPTAQPFLSYKGRRKTYYVCKECGMIYWVGRHFHSIMKTLGDAKNETC
ncbi:MAG: Mut7-C RNAse domain-containing protein [Fervidicoccaceae archaeon]